MADSGKAPGVIALSMLPFHIGVSILRLFFSGGPSAVGRLIVAIVVDAINGLSCRATAHVSKEEIKRLPALANNNTAPAISGIMNVSRVFASIPHTLPNLVFGRVRLPMLADGGSLQAPATFVLATR